MRTAIILAFLALVGCSSPAELVLYAGPERIQVEDVAAYCNETGGRVPADLLELQAMFEVCRDAYTDPFEDGPRYCWTGVELEREGKLWSMVISPVGQVLPNDYAPRTALPLCIAR
jgi:hypothetical protein